MDVIINLANDIFKPILAMGGPIIMLIILTVLALLFGVKFSKALEGGIKLAIALTGIGAIIGMLNGPPISKIGLNSLLASSIMTSIIVPPVFLVI